MTLRFSTIGSGRCNPCSLALVLLWRCSSILCPRRRLARLEKHDCLQVSRDVPYVDTATATSFRFEGIVNSQTAQEGQRHSVDVRVDVRSVDVDIVQIVFR
jgi:hypothetical protein